MRSRAEWTLPSTWAFLASPFSCLSCCFFCLSTSMGLEGALRFRSARAAARCSALEGAFDPLGQGGVSVSNPEEDIGDLSSQQLLDEKLKATKTNTSKDMKTVR